MGAASAGRADKGASRAPGLRPPLQRARLAGWRGYPGKEIKTANGACVLPMSQDCEMTP
jgi:hypothetical protein